ncbi:peptidyl-prolyl cis-trans isomerase [Ensifer sp. B1-9]|uniref:peptidylprolyl isomerase n=1 Tax=Ensifer sp. B1-9 TaxID=3141455 RepID=UPI003D2389E6
MKLLREPLVHFLLAGAALFAAYALIDRAPSQPTPSQHQVRIGQADVRWAAETWTRQWQRSPSPEELRGLVRDLIREEVLAREAYQLGLDKDDAVVRRRLAQKMTFLIEDTSGSAEPTDEELQRFYQAHDQEFRNEARLSFTQVFFDRAQPGADARARRALVEFAGGDDVTPVADKGDQLLIEPEVRDADEASVAAQFGKDFAHAVFAFSPGTWNGPIESSYGLHLVRVEEFIPAEQKPFAEVRDRVLERWREVRRQEASKRYFDDLFKKYQIVIDDSAKALVGTPETDLE